MTVPLQGRPQWAAGYEIPGSDGTSAPTVGGGGWDQWFGSKVDANGGDTSATTVAPLYATAKRPLSAFFGDMTRAKCFDGVLANNENNDTAGLAEVAAYANAQWTAGAIPAPILFEPGFYQSTKAFPIINGPSLLLGTGVRSSVLLFTPDTTQIAGAQGYDCVTFQGNTAISACSGAGIQDLGIFSSTMPSGSAIYFNFCIDVFLENVLMDQPWDAVTVRQTNGCTIDGLSAENIRGDYGVKAFGSGATGLGGATDCVNLLIISSTVLNGNNAAEGGSGPVSTTNLLWCDGQVQTIQVNGVRLLNGGRGAYFTNTPGVANPLWPSFFYGDDLEIENMRSGGIHADYLNGMDISTLFVAGVSGQNNTGTSAPAGSVQFYAATMGSGQYYGPNAKGISLRGGQTNTNYLHGIHIDGADVDISDHDVYNNSNGGLGAYDGIHIGPFAGGTSNTSERVSVRGGRSGKRPDLFGLSGYPLSGNTTGKDPQNYGLNNITGTDVMVSCVSFRGNQQTSGTTGTIIGAASCVGA